MTSLAFMFVDVPAPPWYRPARTGRGSGRRGSPGPPRRSRPGRRAASRRRRSWRARPPSSPARGPRSSRGTARSSRWRSGSSLSREPSGLHSRRRPAPASRRASGRCTPQVRATRNSHHASTRAARRAASAARLRPSDTARERRYMERVSTGPRPRRVDRPGGRDAVVGRLSGHPPDRGVSGHELSHLDALPRPGWVTHELLVGRARFATAAGVLEETDTKILDTALDLGYSDHAHFTRAFRRWADCSPQEYRRRRGATPGSSEVTTT